ncbi:MAG: late competence development ComFB family protein [Treponema sp.]|nr:late competence development ComFB family protein [Treponema sp.]
MDFEREYDFHMLKNVAEDLVIQELEQQLNALDTEICRCNECVVDMAAMALNSVTPLYRFSLMGQLYAAQAKYEQSYADSVQKAVEQAILKVSSNPGHD